MSRSCAGKSFCVARHIIYLFMGRRFSAGETFSARRNEQRQAQQRARDERRKLLEAVHLQPATDDHLKEFHERQEAEAKRKVEEEDAEKILEAVRIAEEAMRRQEEEAKMQARRRSLAQLERAIQKVGTVVALARPVAEAEQSVSAGPVQASPRAVQFSPSRAARSKAASHAALMRLSIDVPTALASHSDFFPEAAAGLDSPSIQSPHPLESSPYALSARAATLVHEAREAQAAGSAGGKAAEGETAPGGTERAQLAPEHLAARAKVRVRRASAANANRRLAFASAPTAAVAAVARQSSTEVGTQVHPDFGHVNVALLPSQPAGQVACGPPPAGGSSPSGSPSGLAPPYNSRHSPLRAKQSSAAHSEQGGAMVASMVAHPFASASRDRLLELSRLAELAELEVRNDLHDLEVQLLRARSSKDPDLRSPKRGSPMSAGRRPMSAGRAAAASGVALTTQASTVDKRLQREHRSGTEQTKPARAPAWL